MHLAVFDMKQLGKKNHNKVRLCFLLNIYLIIRFSVPSRNVTARKVSTKWCIFVTPGAVKQMISFWFVNMFYVNTALSLNISYITYDRSEVYCHLTEKKQRSEFFFFPEYCLKSVSFFLSLILFFLVRLHRPHFLSFFLPVTVLSLENGHKWAE